MSNIKMSILIFVAGCGISMMDYLLIFQLLHVKFPMTSTYLNRWIGRGGAVSVYQTITSISVSWPLFLMGAHEESSIRYSSEI